MQKWKKDRIASMQEALDFFSNKGKFERERWVVEALLKRLGIRFVLNEIIEAEEPADVAYRNARFQVKELFPGGRKRTDEYKEKLEVAMKAEEHSDITEEYTPTTISFTEIVESCKTYASQLIENNKYGARERENTDLLFYFNYVKCQEIPPEEYIFELDGFRSFSVIGNRYCAVLKANDSAPQFLKDNVGKVINNINING